MRLAFLCLLPLLAFGAAAEEARVTIRNETYATRCAEEDNVFITLQAPALRSFAVDAAHPAYIGGVATDSFAPDFTNCNFGPAPPPEGPFFEPRQWVLWENDEYRLVGNTDRHFWRDRDVPVRVGDTVHRNVHLIQFYRKRPGGGRDQVVVLYPPDGHWRTKPLPVPQLDYNVYGASFLIGPVVTTNRRRPYVDYREVAFDPATLTFDVRFAGAGGATVRVAEASRERTTLAVTFDGPFEAGAPFAAMRSMFVSPEVADVGSVAWRDRAGTEHRDPIAEFRQAEAASARFGRTVVSSHNRSAPDQVFRDFAAP